uniref:Secreted protein n=1 Tax=Erythrolobus madagascarensis TaxID=708628 RepID=A0A7S0TA85_9RHOD
MKAMLPLLWGALITLPNGNVVLATFFQPPHLVAPSCPIEIYRLSKARNIEHEHGRSEKLCCENRTGPFNGRHALLLLACTVLVGSSVWRRASFQKTTTFILL